MQHNYMNHVNGLDVSAYQPNVNWQQVHDAGYSFGFAKASEGLGETDDQFARNHIGEIRQHMIAGSYHFLHWDEDPIAQAEHFLSVYSPQVGDLPPVLDCEGTLPDQNKAIQIISAWTGHVENRLSGARCILYMSYDTVVNRLSALKSYFAGHPLWLAAYNTDQAPPNVGWRVRFWQYSDSGKINGITGNVDLNRFYGTYNDLRGLCIQQLR